MQLFQDKDLQIELLSMIIWDRHWLRAVGEVVNQDDFRPIAGGANDTWLLAGIALQFYRRYKEPVGSMITQEVEGWAKASRASEETQNRLWKLLREIKKHYNPGRSDLLQEAVLGFKKTRLRQRILKELIDLEQAGQSDDEKWLRLMHEAVKGFSREVVVDWVDQLEDRISRRMFLLHRRYPAFLIDPLDSLIQSIGRGHIGLWLATYKMGKSLALIWMATVYLLQGLNVLFITLEDPKEDVEDRLDSSVSAIPIGELGLQVELLKEKFTSFKDMLRVRLRIVDGVEDTLSINQIDAIWERQKALGFVADAVIIDYDDEIRPPVKREERRFEFADIYRDFRRFAAHRQIIGWTAAQAVRVAEGRKIISGDLVAEDISKVRKVTLALGLGQGDWGEDSKFIYVAAAKFTRQRIGCTIWSDLPRALLYDRDRTIEWLQQSKRSSEEM